jgi:serine/threonine protein kinase
MLVGFHPLYVTGGILSDSSHSLKEKVATIEPMKWYFPPYVSPLGRDMVCKLCRISQTDRYDAIRALKHPWITRNFDDPIPLTQSDEIQMFSQEQSLLRVIKLMSCLAIIKA